MTSLTRAARLASSAAKVHPPFALDPELRFYSPQENREAFDHPRVADWLRFVEHEWTPAPVTGDERRLALLVPCTKLKPYPISREHRAINRALLAAGWEPRGPGQAPPQLGSVLGDGEDPRVLHDGPLQRGSTVLDRFVLSEPMALVPYEHVYRWRGEPSPATAYDDPGLFESRGTSVSPDRPDSTARQRADGSWAWGPAERDAYVDVHDRLVAVIGATLARIAPAYTGIVAWVSPGLTHRSFLADHDVRRREQLPASRQGLTGRRPLRGVLDEHPGLLRLLPERHHLAAARARLQQRLADEGRASGSGAVRAVFARGDGADTPLGLPELLEELTGALDILTEATT